MEEKENMRIMVEANLRSVTQSSKGGVPLDRLERDYRDLLGTSIPYRDMGYSSLDSMIRSMPDIVKLSRNNIGQLVVMGVADEATAHIASLVSRQRDTKVRKPMFRRPYRMQTNRGPDQRWSPQYSKRFNIRTFQKQWPQGSPQRTSPHKPQVMNENRKPYAPLQKTDAFPKSSFEMPPRFLKLQKGEVPRTKTPSPIPSEEDLRSYIRPPMSAKHPEPVYEASDFPRSPKISTPKTRHTKGKRTVLLPTPNLPIHLSAKEFVAEYAAMHKIEPCYNTTRIGQKRKMYISTLYLDTKQYPTYPEERRTEEEAEELAAALARKEIESRAFEKRFAETPVGAMEDIMLLVSRVEEIVGEKPHGIWSLGVPKEYETKFSEILPDTWLSLVQQHASGSIEFKVQDGLKVPKDACILRVIRTPSGTTSPTSTSSRASISHDDDSILDLNQKALKMAFQGVPRLVLPTERQWAVLVTSVASTVDIAVNLVDYVEQFAAFNEEMSTFYQAQNEPVQRPFKKKLYVARVVDADYSYYHRVRVEDISQDSEQVTCYFVDRGDTLKLDVSDLYELDPSFEYFAFQAIHLKLSGLEDYTDLVSCENLVNYLLDKTLIAEIVSSESVEGGIIAKLYDTSGDDDVNVNELLWEVTITESLVSELPQVGSTTIAYLTHVALDGDIFLRMCNPYFHVVEDELEKLKPVFEEKASTEVLSAVSPDKMYAAKYVDDAWYRAIINETADVTSNEVEVFYVDYGNTHWVPLAFVCDLEPVSKFLASLPFQALHCLLNEVPPVPSLHWTEDAVKLLYDVAPDGEELIVKVEQPSTDLIPAKVGLFKRNEVSMIISINQTLAFRKDLFREEENSSRKSSSSSGAVVKPTSLPLCENKGLHSNALSSYIPDVAVPAAEIEVQKRQSSSSDPSQYLLWTPTPDAAGEPIGEGSGDFLPVMNIPDSGLFDVYVTIVASPSNFVVQPMGTSKELNDLQTEMQQFYSSEENFCELYNCMLKEEHLYAALHSDNIWYRVRVKTVQEDPVMAAVHFIDYGDFSVVSMSNLQVLWNRFKTLPAQAIRASLAGVKPRSQDWEVEQCVLFKERVEEKSFVSTIKAKRTSKTDSDSIVLELELIDTTHPDQDIYVHEELIEKNVALPV